QRCRPWIERAIAIDRETSADEVLSLILAGRAQLWPTEGACIVTQCALSPGGALIHAWLGGGNLREMIQLRVGIEAYGRAMGCQFATIEGRRGWERLYRPHGYCLEDGVLRKRL
ncbi:MAG: hypothetical protein DI570_23820, partial [Phenylobacterium zucineum]